MFSKWFKRKHKRAGETSDARDDGSDNSIHRNDIRSMEVHPCILSNELRIFVGTWNVGGRPPLGSLAVDLDDWLNLKDAADLYVLGFQEIVPLKTRTVIGAENPAPATNWILLIEQTLNNKYGCPWLTPFFETASSDSNSHHGRASKSEWRRITGHSHTPMRDQQRIQDREKPNKGTKYHLLGSKKMVGVFISVWIKKELLFRYVISNVKVCSVACGIMGCLGNKGAVSVSLSIEGTSFSFIAAHLASGEKKGDEGKRNRQVSEIFRRTSFTRLSKKEADDSCPLTILGHDRIFWFGDLNYRLYLEDDLARHLIRKEDWKALQEFDQLRKELQDGGVFQGWREGNIEFAPTYKYSSANANRYSGGLPSTPGEKQRTPAWCDRILWYGKGVKQLSYFRSESKFSDHRPVSALFSTQIEVLSTNPRVTALHKLTTMKRTPSLTKGR